MDKMLKGIYGLTLKMGMGRHLCGSWHFVYKNNHYGNMFSKIDSVDDLIDDAKKCYKRLKRKEKSDG